MVKNIMKDSHEKDDKKVMKRKTSSFVCWLNKLPKEITFEIFSRASVESLVQCKRVSRSWNTIISDPQLINTHLLHATQAKHPDLLVFTNDRSKFYKVSNVGSAHESVQSFLLPKGLSDPVNSCNGLLAFPKYEWTKHKLSVHVWNPLTRKRTRHPPSRDLHVCGWLNHHRDFKNFRTCGLGYDSILNEYKIIAFLGSETVVCTIGSTSWRLVREVPFVPLDKKFSIHLNGTLYWFASVAQSIKGIGSFGVGNEKFAFVAFPTEVGNCLHYLDLSVLGGCLYLTNYESRENVMVWALKKSCDGGEEVWIKQFMLSMPNSCSALRLLCAFSNGEILLTYKMYGCKENRWIRKCVCYDPKNNQYRHDQTFTSSFSSEPELTTIVHVGSLVSLSQRLI